MIEPAEFAARREAAMAAIGPHAVLVVAARPERIRNGDAHYGFRQDSDVWYLTGFPEPECVVVLRPSAARERVVMFVRPRDAASELWDGKRAGVDGAVTAYGADVAYPFDELAQRLPQLITNVDELHYAVGIEPGLDAVVMRAIAGLRKQEKRGQRPPRAICDPRYSLHELRLCKSEAELALLARAAKISCDAHLAAMRVGRPGVGEHELEAELGYGFRKHGATGPGYGSIVGAGANATVLHYVANDATIADGDLVLVDAGAEVAGYTADITRTWPANGRFSAPQRAVYQAVLHVQKALIAAVQPGVTLDELHHQAIVGLTTAMIDLGLLAGTVDACIADGSYRRFYPHGTSHWLGLDVHDAGAYMPRGKARPLVPGMVITVEPGLYIPVDAQDVPAAYRGIGVRIEDDIVVVAGGHRNLTAGCPKEVDALEQICAREAATVPAAGVHG